MEIILKYFKNLEVTQIKQFGKLQELYDEWNEKINVISRNDVQHLYERHVLHSMAIAHFFALKPKQSILDVGTGGGFPGIPLAILFPETQFFLIDSIGKKIKVVAAVAEALGLSNVTAAHQRVQEMNKKFDYVVSRAVTNLPDFVTMSRRVLKAKQIGQKDNGILYLKGGDFEDELNKVNMDYNIFGLSEIFDEVFFETKKLVHIYPK